MPSSCSSNSMTPTCRHRVATPSTFGFGEVDPTLGIAPDLAPHHLAGVQIDGGVDGGLVVTGVDLGLLSWAETELHDGDARALVDVGAEPVARRDRCGTEEFVLIDPPLDVLMGLVVSNDRRALSSGSQHETIAHRDVVVFEWASGGDDPRGGVDRHE